MAWLDYTFFGVVLLSVLIGVLRGFVREALSLTTWILAFVMTLRDGPALANRLQSLIQSPVLRSAAGYVLVFLGVLLIGALLTYLISILVRNGGLSPVDRMLGAGFGLIRGTLLVVALVMLAGLTTLHEEHWWQASRLAPRLKPAADSLQGLIPASWLAYLRSGEPKPAGVLMDRPEH